MKKYLLGLLLVLPIIATSKTTTSVTDGNWGNAATWDNGKPSTGDIVIVNHNVAFNSTFSLGAGTLTINAGASLIKTAGQDIKDWNVNGKIYNYGTLIFDIYEGKGYIYNEGTFTCRKIDDLYGTGLFVNKGTVSISAAFNLSGSASFVNYGDISFASANIWTSGDIKNYGNFTQTGTSEISCGVDSIINEGTMSLYGLDASTTSLVNNGDLEIREDVNDFYDGIFTNNGTFTVGDRFDVTGDTEIHNNSTIIVEGDYINNSFGGYMSVNNGQIHVKGRMYNHADMENNGAIYVYGGNLYNEELMTTGSCGHINVNCNTFVNDWGGVISGNLNIYGTTNLTNGTGSPSTTLGYNKCATPGTMYARVDGNWSNNTCGSATWSRIEVDGIESLDIPGPGDTVIIDNHSITLDGSGDVYDVAWLRVRDENGTAELDVSGTVALGIADKLEIKNTNAARAATLIMDNSSAFDVGGGLHLEATGNSRATLTMNGTSAITLEGDISRGSNLYGVIDGNDNSSITLDGSSDQTITGTDASVSDEAEFNILKINNTNATVPMVAIDNTIKVGEELDLTDGVVFVDAGDKITVMDDAAMTNASGASYIIGWVNKIGNDAFTFPTGDAGAYRYIGMSAPDDATDEFRAKYFGSNPDDDGYDTSLVAGLNHVSGEEYWLIEPVSGTASIKITLPTMSNPAYVDTIADVRVAHWTGATWEDEGKTATSGDKNNGSVTSDFVSSFSPFSTGQTDSPLPVELVRFDGEMTDEGALLEWMTASERDNAWFVVEKMDAKGEFVEIARLAGAGNANSPNSYDFIDEYTSIGYNYYRLGQIDYDGQENVFNIVCVAAGHNNQSESYYANGNLKVIVNNYSYDNARAMLFDAHGRIVLLESIHGGENSFNLSGLAKGPYVLKVITGQNAYTKKIFVY